MTTLNLDVGGARHLSINSGMPSLPSIGGSGDSGFSDAMSGLMEGLKKKREDDAAREKAANNSKPDAQTPEAANTLNMNVDANAILGSYDKNDPNFTSPINKVEATTGKGGVVQTSDYRLPTNQQGMVPTDTPKTSTLDLAPLIGGTDYKGVQY